jgi:hypothetical protein
LDKAEILDPIKDAAGSKEMCGKEEEQFEKDCAKSWVR